MILDPNPALLSLSMSTVSATVLQHSNRMSTLREMEKMVEYKKPVINGVLTTHEQQAPLKEWLDLT